MNPFALTHRLRFSLLLLAGFTLTTAEMEAQERKEEIRLEVTQKPLSQVFRQLEKRTDYKFVYSHDDVRGLTAGQVCLHRVRSGRFVARSASAGAPRHRERPGG